MSLVLPGSESLESFISVRSVEDGKALADPIFLRRYRAEAPDFPHHVLAFYRDPSGVETPVAYIHFSEFGRTLLGGGACVDDRVMRKMSVEARTAIRDAGGLYRYALGWSVRHFADRYDAIFGYCGDALAERVDLAVGFARTAHPHLLVYFTQPLPEQTQAQLISNVNALGPF